MKGFRSLVLWVGLSATFAGAATITPGTPLLVFAVITEATQGQSHFQAHVFVEGQVMKATLIAGKDVQTNRMWNQVESCQSLRAQAVKTPEGYRVLSFRMLGAEMLPMPLQGIAGDCLLKKALEFAPLLE